MQLLDRDLPDVELKANVDRFLWLDLNLLSEDTRRIIDPPPDIPPHNLVTFVPSHQGVRAGWNSADLGPSFRNHDRKIRMVKSSAIAVHVDVDIALLSHHSVAMMLEVRMVNFPVRCGHGDIQERGRFLVEKM